MFAGFDSLKVIVLFVCELDYTGCAVCFWFTKKSLLFCVYFDLFCLSVFLSIFAVSVNWAWGSAGKSEGEIYL